MEALVNMFKSISIILLLVFVVSTYATVNITGYSGAPGTQGTCAGKCHGASEGTIIVQGFPKNYVPSQTYVVTVAHNSGTKISNFNASVHIGTTSKRAGTISAGYQTATYNVAAESNGIHLASANKDTGKFYWTAPKNDIGEVKLYLAGMQGTTLGGKNTKLTLVSQPAKTFTETDTNKIIYLTINLRPIEITDSMTIEISVPAEKSAELKIIQDDGQSISTIPVVASLNPVQTIIWQTNDNDGKKLPDGLYTAVLTCENEQVIKKFTIEDK